MKKNDSITIENAIKAAKYCYTMGQLFKEKNECYDVESLEMLQFIGLLGSAFNVLGVTEKIQDLLECVAEEKINTDEVAKKIGMNDMIEFACYSSALKQFSKEDVSEILVKMGCKKGQEDA